MKSIVLILFHLFRARYPDLFGMAEPDTVKDERVIPVNDQPDQIRIPEPFPERIRSIQPFQDESKDEYKDNHGDAFPEDVRLCKSLPSVLDQTQFDTLIPDSRGIIAH